MSGNNLYLRFPNGKSKALTFSYDDGVIQDKRLVEIFEKNSLKGTFNVNSGIILPEEQLDPTKKHRRLTAKEMIETYKKEVCEVVCHAYNHLALDQCDSAVIMNELIYDRQHLEEMFGCQVHGFAYPYGSYNDKVLKACKSAGLYYARTTISTRNFGIPKNWLELNPTCHHGNPALMELADKFLEEYKGKSPRLFYVWGHSYEFDNNDNWKIIEDFAKKMSGKDDIWYATNIEIYNAWRDFNRLNYSCDSSIVHNPNANDVWVADKNGKVYCIPSGQSIEI